MFKISAVMFMVLLGACSSAPQNSSNKPFDANSAYCQQLLRDSQIQQSANPNRVLVPDDQLTRTDDIRNREEDLRNAAKRAYALDCENPAEYQNRLREE